MLNYQEQTEMDPVLSGKIMFEVVAKRRGMRYSYKGNGI